MLEAAGLCTGLALGLHVLVRTASRHGIAETRLARTNEKDVNIVITWRLAG
jgi:hypothetical protein